MSSLLMCTWHGDLATANFLVQSSCVTLDVLRQQQWLVLSGRCQRSEELLSRWREIAKSPDSLCRLCRNAIRAHLRQLTEDRDIRTKLCQLQSILPTSIVKFVISIFISVI